MDIANRPKIEDSTSLINKIHSSFSDVLHFATPISSLRTNEFDLVRGVLQMLQGLSSSIFNWDHVGQSFRAKSGIYLTHLSQTSLHVVLDQFIYAATCLQLVEIVVNKVETSARRTPPPTLRAFSCSVSTWLRRLRDIALKEEETIISSDSRTSPTLLGLVSSLSSLCSGAEYLFQLVHGAIPQMYFEFESPVPAADVAVYILDYLYKKLNEVCFVEGGEEDAYRMLLYIFVGSLFPYIEGLDSWLFEGTLDDPFEELFFYANKAISVDDAEFWDKSYLLRPMKYQKLDGAYANDKKEMTGKESISVTNSGKGKERYDIDLQGCPLFIKDISKAIVSAGKSLQLIRHAPVTSGGGDNCEIDGFERYDDNTDGQRNAGLTLSEVFCVSLAGVIGHGDHISSYFLQDEPCNPKIVPLLQSFVEELKLEEGNDESLPARTCLEKIWCRLLVDTMFQKRGVNLESENKGANDFPHVKEEIVGTVDELNLVRSFYPENPVITVCQMPLHENINAWNTLNLSRNFYLPPLDDEGLRNAIFCGNNGPSFTAKGTNYTLGFQFGESEHRRLQDDTKMLEALFPFPTLLPPFEENLRISELLPFQKNSTLPSRVLSWILSVEAKATPLPIVFLQECLVVFIKKQVDYIGRHILSKLLYEWRLIDELGVLRAIYLLGSGDLLQHFLTVTFNKLDKGEMCDDDFELNTILQESIRNSADGMLLSAPDTLVVSLTTTHGFSGDEQPNTAALVSTPRKSRGNCLGIDGLDSLKFTYKVSWPLELIANSEAIKKYNQVMGFLLKVKRAKFVLDKARRWMWKGRGTPTVNRKHHWLLEQKLLHFVDAFHQYVMDRVYHSAWRELCEGMAAARSLDEVIEVHETYLLSIQRQCFVVPDKLGALIASRINSILGLALDFYSVQQTLSSGGTVSAIKSRCEMEVDRIEKQFNECMAFLLRVLSFKLNVGHFPHLADLVTRINYNYFYMSDSGNLAAETGASKLGKAFAARTD